MQTTQEFVATHADPKDPARPMLAELERRMKALTDAKIQTVQWLCPIKTKSGWDVSLSGDPEAIEELAGRIEVAEGMLTETKCDIITYAELLSEIDAIKKVQNRVTNAKMNFDGHAAYYRNVVLGAIEDNTGKDLADIKEIPRVQKAKARLDAAEKGLADAEAELEKVIGVLEAKQVQTAAILSKYS